jgi:hypothetical protein
MATKKTPGRLGRDEGKHTGPAPGEGADLGGTMDVEGTAPDELPAAAPASKPSDASRQSEGRSK